MWPVLPGSLPGLLLRLASPHKGPLADFSLTTNLAGLLAKYGKKVLVCESHDVPGGAAHAWTVRAPDGGGLYHFESGPSLYSGALAASCRAGGAA